MHAIFNSHHFIASSTCQHQVSLSSVRMLLAQTAQQLVQLKGCNVLLCMFLQNAAGQAGGRGKKNTQRPCMQLVERRAQPH